MGYVLAPSVSQVKKFLGKSVGCNQPVYIEYNTHTIYYHTHHARTHINKYAYAQKHTHSCPTHTRSAVIAVHPPIIAAYTTQIVQMAKRN